MTLAPMAWWAGREPPAREAVAETNLRASPWAPGRHRRITLIIIGLVVVVVVGIGAILTSTRDAIPRVTATIQVGGTPQGVAVSPDGQRAYVTNTYTGSRDYPAED
jgi:hypothetical protein